MERFGLWLESSFGDLYQSTVQGFPNTTKRQFSTDSVKIVQLHWTPFLGTRTLFLRGLAQNFDSTPTSEYRPIITFKNVQYHNEAAPGLVEIVASDGQQYHLEPLSRVTSDILCRCQCGDFRWRGAWYDWLDGSLVGRPPARYESLGIGPPANPMEVKMVCKHIMKLFLALQDAGLVTLY